MFRKVLEMSQREEDDRVRRTTNQKDQEDRLIEQSLREAEAEKAKSAKSQTNTAKPIADVPKPMVELTKPIVKE
jgi:hypothetical protein